MKIVCGKNSSVRQMLQKLNTLLEQESVDYPILEEELVIDIRLKDEHDISSPKNEEQISLEDFKEQELEEDNLAYYYRKDVLTNLYNRAKYERDIVKFERKPFDSMACIYMDVVGLHEINNHLGHTAGDRMLCRVADGIRECFPEAYAYRIGGDEFIIFCFDWKKDSLEKAISDLKQYVHQEEYEISTGMAISSDNSHVAEVINQAEKRMRKNKAAFYRQDGGKRQMRGLNRKLEQILIENQDANQFLQVIADEYKGVYMVNADKDTCRHIYVPPYFQTLLKKYKGCYSKAICEYCQTLVQKEDQYLFENLFDYEYVLDKLKKGEQISFLYHKTDGSTVHLQITVYNQNKADSREMLWVFMDEDRT